MIGDGVRCMLMRGGSSKGLYFLADDLPTGTAERDRVLLSLMGSPDPRQIDGLGGAHPLTSKVAVVGPSDVADVSYLFLQLGVDTAMVTDRQNCGNLLAGVGPFAVERGLVEVPSDGPAEVRVHMRNTDSFATASFEMRGGRVVTAGSTSIAGVPGSGAPIRLDFEGLAGASTGALLPSGSRVDEIAGVPCTLIDNGMPVVIVAAAALGATGHETCAELESSASLRARLEEIRRSAGPLMNLGDVADLSVPKLTLVASPRSGGDLCTRTFVPHRCHDAIGVFGAVSVATAALVEGTPAHTVYEPSGGETIVLEHPSGSFEAAVEVADRDGLPTVVRAGIVRTARPLMDGIAYPRDR